MLNKKINDLNEVIDQNNRNFSVKDKQINELKSIILECETLSNETNNKLLQLSKNNENNNNVIDD